MKKKNILEIEKIYLEGKIELMKEFLGWSGHPINQERIKLLEVDWDNFYNNHKKVGA